MRSFVYHRASRPEDAVQLASLSSVGPPTAAKAQYLAGGTNIADYMRLNVAHPEVLVDINDLERTHGSIDATPQNLRMGALVRMAKAADDPVIKRDYPVIAQSLVLAASPQIRNMASLGGNVLQRTRCQYFRDTLWRACNKREPGTGCAALDGLNRKHAVLGVSDHCIASYPGDFAQALVALGASVELMSPSGSRVIRFEDLHRLPADTPDVETVLRPGELIVAFIVPAGPWTRRSLYQKIRDRQSYEFGIATAAVALHIEGGTVREARIGLGGVAAKPWRAHEAEHVLKGRALDEDAASAAARLAFAGAVTHGNNRFKPELGRRTLTQALLAAGRMDI
jgi:xanthine dehydrogenase YagS FAD-binding subunit